MYSLSRRPWQICTPKKHSGVKAAVKTRTRSSVGRASCNTQEYKSGKRAACPSQQLCLPLPPCHPGPVAYPLWGQNGDNLPNRSFVFHRAPDNLYEAGLCPAPGSRTRGCWLFFFAKRAMKAPVLPPRTHFVLFCEALLLSEEPIMCYQYIKKKN